MPIEGKPNVIWILIDTLRPDHLGAYGYERNTSPNIDALAESGVVFEQHFAQGVNTLFSVPTMLSGRYFPVFLQGEHHMDVWFMHEQPKDEIWPSQLFGRNGYTTAMFNASPWYTQRSRIAKSFDHYEPLAHASYITDSDFRKQNPGLFDWLSEKKDEQFFAIVHTLDAHGPRLRLNTHETWLNPDFDEARDNELRSWEGTQFSESDQAHIQNLYDGGISYADYTVGEILSHLDHLGIREETAIIISSDHGEMLAEDGKLLGHPPRNHTDEQLLVPLIMSGPGIPQSVRVKSPTQNVDIMPTIAEIYNLSNSARFDGTSLRPLMTGQPAQVATPIIYSKVANFFLTTEPTHIIRHESTKYVLKSLTKDKHRLSWESVLEQKQAYTLPDSIHHRSLLTSDIPLSDTVRQFAQDRLAPSWIDFESIPTTTPPKFRAPHWEAPMREYLTPANNSDDNLWTRVVNGNPYTPSNSVFYIAHNGSETPPTIKGAKKIPNGTYRVSILAGSGIKNGIRQTTSFRIALHNPEQDQLISLPPPEHANKITEWIGLGEFEVTDGYFRYEISPGNPGDLSFFGGLHFEDVNQVQESDVDFDKINEELDALGYLN